MAYIRRAKYKSKVSFQVQIRRKGIKTLVKTFATRTDAKKWARTIERELDQGNCIDYSEANRLTLGDLFKRYIHENKHKKNKSWKMYEFRTNILLKDTIADTNLLRLSSRYLSEFKDRKRKEVGPSTYNKYLSLISVVIETAIREWGIYLPNNPVRNAEREKEAIPRNRTLVGDEYQRLMEACGLSGNTYLQYLVQFSIETAMRKGEVLASRYEDINFANQTLTIPVTKNGEPRTIPLSGKAISILQSMPRRLDGKIFPITPDSLKFWWNQALRRAGITDFRYHDLRRYACSTLFERGLSVPEVQLISGHKDPRVLLNTYTKLDPAKLVKKLG